MKRRESYTTTPSRTTSAKKYCPRSDLVVDVFDVVHHERDRHAPSDSPGSRGDLGPQGFVVGQCRGRDDDHQVEIAEVAVREIFDPVTARVAAEEHDQLDGRA
jgi:hypothetical protein